MTGVRKSDARSRTRDGAYPDKIRVTVSKPAAAESGMTASTQARICELEARLAQSEDRFRALAHSGAQITWTSTPKGVVDDLPYWRAFTGQTEAEIQGFGWLDAVHPEDRKRVVHEFADDFASGRPFETEYRLRRADGVYRWFLVRSTPVHELDGTLREWVGSCTDISERKALEEALRETEQRASAALRDLEAVFASMTDHVLVYDAEGRIVRHNGALSPLLAAPKEDTLLREARERRNGVFDVRDAEGNPLVAEQAPVSRILRGETFTGQGAVDVRVRSLDGREVLLSVTGGPVRDEGGCLTGAVVVLHDVTERRRVERLAMERASELEALFEAIGDGVLVYDVEGRIVRANGMIRAMLALDCDPDYAALPQEERARLLDIRDARGDPIPAERSILRRALRGVASTGPDTVDKQLRALDGRVVYANVSAAPILAPGGEVLGAVQVFRDVGRRRAAEEERAHILSVVAHELNTPLASLKARSQLLVRRLNGRGAHAPEQLAATADELAFDVRRMERLVKDLQDAARLETRQLELHTTRCDLRALCQQAVREHMTAGRRFMTVALPRTPLEVEADPDRIAQVLGNLLSNALKYSPAERPVTVRLRREGRHAHVTVEDEGPGIAPEALPHVFERFYRAGGSAAQNGTGVGLGLGLFISHSLVERHGGDMGVESAVGVGSTFWFTLPLPG